MSTFPLLLFTLLIFSEISFGQYNKYAKETKTVYNTRFKGCDDQIVSRRKAHTILKGYRNYKKCLGAGLRNKSKCTRTYCNKNKNGQILISKCPLDTQMA